MNDDTLIEGESLTKEDEFWLEQGKDLVKNSIPAIEAAGKQLITLLTTMKGIYLAVIVFSKDAPLWLQIALVFPLIIWLIALRRALNIFQTQAHSLHLNEPEKIKTVISTIAADKQKQLHHTYWLIVLGFVFAMFNFVVYFSLK